MSLVSVIIPNHNSLAFIPETLESVFNQTYKSIELIIVDDGSTDGSYEYLAQQNEPSLKVVKNPSKGACAARNYGLRLAKGAFVQFLDADDILDTKKIEIQVRAINENIDSIAVCSTRHFYDSINNGKITDTGFLHTTDDTASFLLKLYGADGLTHNMVQTSAWLTPKALLDKAGPWDETLTKDQDGEYFCRVVATANKVIYTPEVLNYYRKHLGGQNIANQRQRMHVESQLKALEAKANHLKKLADSQAYKNAFALQYKLLAIDAYPQFKDVYKIAIQQSKTLGGSKHLPVLGGRIIESIKQVFGWRMAKQFSYWIHKII